MLPIVIKVSVSVRAMTFPSREGWGLNEKIMVRFDKEGIKMTSPRLEIDERPDRGVHEISEGPSGQ